jgi:hypothetical protein
MGGGDAVKNLSFVRSNLMIFGVVQHGVQRIYDGGGSSEPVGTASDVQSNWCRHFQVVLEQADEHDQTL